MNGDGAAGQHQLPARASSQALRDLDTFRQFLTGGSFYALFDAPWAPIYIVVIWRCCTRCSGVIGLVFALVLLALALVNEWLIGAAARRGRRGGRPQLRLHRGERCGTRTSIEAMGMLGGLLKRWSHDRNGMLAAPGQGERPRRGADRASSAFCASRCSR